MTLLCLLLACGDDGTVGETADSAPVVAGRLSTVTWDGADGLVAAWHSGVGVETYGLVITDADGSAQWTFTDATEAHVTGLADGRYTLSLAGDDASLTQLVGENRLVLLGQVTLEGIQDVWGEGDVVVAAGGLSRDADLYVVDATDPSAPELVAQVSDLSEVRDVHLEDGVLYAASDTQVADGVGVWILDLTDPATPSVLGSIPGSVHNLHFGEGHLFLADMVASAVSIYDVSDPWGPAWVADWAMPLGVHDVTWIDGLLYVAGPQGLTILDVSDPAVPTPLLEHVPPPGNPPDSYHNVWPSEDGSHLFTSHEVIGGRMKVWQVGYGVLEQVASWPEDEPNCLHNVHVRGEHAFVSWYLDGVRVFDVSTPAEPALIGWHDTFEETEQQPGDVPDIRGAWGVWPYGEHVVVSDSQTGLWWFDFFPVTVSAG